MPCSAQTAAARARVQVERALPNWRGLWCKSAFSRSLRSASKSLAAVCGRRDCMATTASPRVSNARRTLRTACGLHPTAWAMTVVVSPRAEAKRMWQRRTVNPSDERSPACKAWRSCHPSDFLARWTFLCLKGIRRAWGGLRMGGIATVAAAIGADLAARLPRQNKKQREGLALLVATALDVRDVNLMELAAALPRAAERLDMRYQWISRLL